MLLDIIYGLYVLDSRPSSEFNFEAAKNKLINLDIASDHGPQVMFTTPDDDITGNATRGWDPVDLAAGRYSRLMRLAGWIDLDSRLTVR